MNPVAKLLRQTAENIRKLGFSPSVGSAFGGPRCFMGHMPHCAYDDAATLVLSNIIGTHSYSDGYLIRSGWDESATEDAAAACEIAADIAEVLIDADATASTAYTAASRIDEEEYV